MAINFQTENSNKMKLEKILSLENVSLDMEAKADGKKAKDIFCDKWDNAKESLQLIVVMVKNPIAKLIITIVMALGDGIQAKICK